MAKKEGERPRGSRLKRMFWTIVLLGAVAGGVYGASWMNSRRYFLIVKETEVRVAKGRMLPVGYETFVPKEVELRRAYETFMLPSAINIPRGETTFNERLELDQALFRLLKDCIAFSLSRDDRGTPELVTKYLAQIRSIPGTSVSQQIELEALERDAAYASAKGKVEIAAAALKDAARLFRESTKGPGARSSDGDARARNIDQVLGGLDAYDASQHEKTRPNSTDPKNGASLTTRTTTTATRATGH